MTLTFQESRDRRYGHGWVEEYDIVTPASYRGGIPCAGNTTAADPSHRAAAEARQAGLAAPAHRFAAPSMPLYQRHATRLLTLSTGILVIVTTLGTSSGDFI